MPEPLFDAFAWVFIVIMFLMIVLPYIFKRSDLLTTWNFFLAGSGLFVGYSVVNSSYSSHMVPYSNMDYLLYWLGALAFYGTITFVYYRFKFPRKLSTKILQKWPPTKPAVLFFMIPLAGFFMLGILFPQLLAFAGGRALMGYTAVPAIILPPALAFAAWYKQRINLIFFLVAIIVAGIVMVFLIRYAPTRRPFLSLLLSFAMIMYWMRWRYKKPILIVALAGISVPLLILAITIYTENRWEKKGGFSETTEIAKEKLHSMFLLDFSKVPVLLKTDTAECALLSVHMYTNDKTPRPFYTAYWLITNPIPRVFWSGKPDSLSMTIPHDGRMLYGLSNAYVSEGNNWGCSIIGHGYHDGGIPVLMVYAIILGIFLRTIDELLMAQPDNPYLIAGVSTFLGEIIAWSRGDIGGFTLIIIAYGAVVWFICRVGRLIYGTRLASSNSSKKILVRKTLRACPKGGTGT